MAPSLLLQPLLLRLGAGSDVAPNEMRAAPDLSQPRQNPAVDVSAVHVPNRHYEFARDTDSARTLTQPSAQCALPRTSSPCDGVCEMELGADPWSDAELAAGMAAPTAPLASTTSPRPADAIGSLLWREDPIAGVLLALRLRLLGLGAPPALSISTRQKPCGPRAAQLAAALPGSLPDCLRVLALHGISGAGVSHAAAVLLARPGSCLQILRLPSCRLIADDAYRLVAALRDRCTLTALDLR